MSDKVSAATRFMFGGGVVPSPTGMMPEFKRGTILAAEMTEPWVLLNPIGKGMSKLFAAAPLRTVAELSLPGLLPRIPTRPGIYQCDQTTEALLDMMLAGEPIFALKVMTMSPGNTYYEEMLRRFKQEAHLLGTMNIPQLPRFAGTFRTAPAPFFVMEYLWGEPLDREITRLEAKFRFVPWTSLANYFSDACAAVRACHEDGVIHRDLKPANFFLAQVPGWKRTILRLIDFGIAKVIAEAARPVLGEVPGSRRRRDVELTMADSPIMATVEFAAPEQVEDDVARRITDARTDVYALGCILYRMAAGKNFLPTTQDLSVLRAAQQQAVQGIEHPEIGQQASALLHRLLQRMLHPVKESRSASIAEVQGLFIAIRAKNREETGRY